MSTLKFQKDNIAYDTNFFKKRNVFLFLNFYLIFFLAALSLCCIVLAFSSCGERGLLFIAVCGLLLLWSMGCRHAGFSSTEVVAHGLSSCGLRVVERRLSSCGAWA